MNVDRGLEEALEAIDRMSEEWMLCWWGLEMPFPP